MQSLHPHLWKYDLLKFEATPKLLKLLSRGVKIKSGVFKFAKVNKRSPPFIMSFKVVYSRQNALQESSIVLFRVRKSHGSTACTSSRKFNTLQESLIPRKFHVCKQGYFACEYSRDETGGILLGYCDAEDLFLRNCQQDEGLICLSGVH